MTAEMTVETRPSAQPLSIFVVAAEESGDAIPRRVPVAFLPRSALARPFVSPLGALIGTFVGPAGALICAFVSPRGAFVVELIRPTLACDDALGDPLSARGHV